jgi:mRNA-degrading endonuclease RelE of RelBE toxin-antitoxin system
MGKFRKAFRAWRRLPRKTQRRIKRKARGLVGRSSDSSKERRK